MVLAAQPPALPHRAAALLLAAVGGQQAAGAALGQVVVALPQLAGAGGGEGRSQLQHADARGGGRRGGVGDLCYGTQTGEK